MGEYIYKPPASLPPGSAVIAYLRDSGGPNQEDSIGQQLHKVQDFCKQYGLILSRVFSDTGSGKNNDRVQFKEMCDLIEIMPQELRPRGLILWAYSRFSRNILHFNRYLYGLLMQGLIVHSLTEEIPEGLAGQLMLSVKAYTNAEFSVNLGKNIKRGIEERVRTGYNNGGQAPRGYRVEREFHDSRRNGVQRIGVKWIPDPDLAPLVRQAWELRAQGKGYAEITRATTGKIYTTKNSWASHFKNKSYLGIGKAGDLEIPDHHEALITYELWEAVKRVEAAMPRQKRSGELLHPRRMSHPSLLSGLSFCIYCGSAMVLHTAKEYRSYACGSRDRQRVYKDCKQARRVNASKADTAVLDAVLTRVLPSFLAEEGLQDIQDRMSNTSRIDCEIGEVNKSLIKVSRSIARQLQLAEGTGSLPEIAARLKELKQDEAKYNAQIKELKAQRFVDIPQITPEALAFVIDRLCLQIQNATQSHDTLLAKQLLSKFVSRIELSRNVVRIHYTFPIVEFAEQGNEFLRPQDPRRSEDSFFA